LQDDATYLYIDADFLMGNITPWGGMFFVGGNAQQKHLIPDGASPPEISCNEGSLRS